MTTRYWKGGAVVVKEMWTMTVGGSWTGTDTLTITINSRSLTLTVDGARVTPDLVGEDFADMMDGNDANALEGRSILGTEVGEFNLLDAFHTGAGTIWLYGAEDGRPIGTPTVSRVTSSSGTFSIVKTTSGESPTMFDLAENWDGGVVPVDTDDVVFDYRASHSCKYNISQGSLDLASMVARSSYKYGVGLSVINTTNPSTPFTEYLDTYLTLSSCTALEIDNSSGSSMKVDTGSLACEALIWSTGQSIDEFLPSCLLHMNHSSSMLHVSGGDVGVNVEDDQSGTVNTVTVTSDASPSLRVGAGSSITYAKQSSGIIKCGSTCTYVTISAGICEFYGASVINTLRINGGLFSLYSDGGISSLYMTRGTFDASVDSRDKTIGTMHMYSRGTVMDPLGVLTITNGVKIYGHIDDVTLEFPATRTWKITSI